jgi:hypothetical protein
MSEAELVTLVLTSFFVGFAAFIAGFTAGRLM